MVSNVGGHDGDRAPTCSAIRSCSVSQLPLVMFDVGGDVVRVAAMCGARFAQVQGRVRSCLAIVGDRQERDRRAGKSASADMDRHTQQVEGVQQGERHVEIAEPQLCRVLTGGVEQGERRRPAVRGVGVEPAGQGHDPLVEQALGQPVRAGVDNGPVHRRGGTYI